MSTPASTPVATTPAIAATAIQKSTRAVRLRRRIRPDGLQRTTARPARSSSRTPSIDDRRDSTGLGSAENSGVSTSRVRTTNVPVVSEATGVSAPLWSLSELADRLVDTGMPLQDARPEVGHALGDGLLVDVDAVAMPGLELAGIPSGL
jgi:hypothetical protein